MNNLAENIKTVFSSMLGLFYPDYCQGCGKPLLTGEHYICVDCLTDLPYTYFNNSRKNIVSELLWGRINTLTKAYSMCYFTKSSQLQSLLHNLKYNNQPEVGMELGIYLAHELEKVNLNDFDVIVPVPLHAKKMKIRGYNQSEKIAEGIRILITKPIDTKSVIRKIFTNTQTKKNKVERWENVKDIFEVKHPENLKNKHILLVDDVITTGATIEALSNTIEKVPGVKISVASVAVSKKI